MEFEDVLKTVGGYGLFNKLILNSALVLSTWHATMCFFGHLLVHVTPPSQWCFLNDTDPTSLDMTTLERGKCQMMTALESGDYTNASVSNGDVMTCPTGWRYDNNEFFTTVTMENQWVCGENWKMYAIHTTYWIGSMTGYLISGFLADRIGRRMIIIVLIVIGIVGNVLGTFFSGFYAFAALRFLSGVGSDAVCTAAYVIVMEYTVCERRTLISFLWAINWSVLATALPWYTAWLQSWRGIMFTTTGIDVLMLLVMCWVPESSGWLLSVGRKKEALAHFEKIARFNGKVVSPDDLSKQLEGPASEAGSSAVKVIPTFWESSRAVLKFPRMRKRVFLIYISCFIISLCYNANALNIGRLSVNLYASYSLAMSFELPVNFICIMALDTIGRRWPNSLFMLMGAIISFVVGFLRTDSVLGTMIMSALCSMSFAGGYNITYQLTSEIFPTVIRGRAVLLQRLVADFGGLLGAQVASLVEYDKFLPALVNGALSLVAAVLLFLLPDSINQPLPQTLEDGENLAPNQSLCFCPLFSEKTNHCGRKRSASITNSATPDSSVVVDPPATFTASTTT
ncbi:putative organic cation/carnitine transporter [Ixodes scapularis]